jgi:hypothetical protein
VRGGAAGRRRPEARAGPQGGLCLPGRCEPAARQGAAQQAAVGSPSALTSRPAAPPLCPAAVPQPVEPAAVGRVIPGAGPLPHPPHAPRRVWPQPQERHRRRRRVPAQRRAAAQDRGCALWFRRALGRPAQLLAPGSRAGSGRAGAWGCLRRRSAASAAPQAAPARPGSRAVLVPWLTPPAARPPLHRLAALAARAGRVDPDHAPVRRLLRVPAVQQAHPARQEPALLALQVSRRRARCSARCSRRRSSSSSPRRRWRLFGRAGGQGAGLAARPAAAPAAPSTRVQARQQPGRACLSPGRCRPRLAAGATPSTSWRCGSPRWCALASCWAWRRTACTWPSGARGCRSAAGARAACMLAARWEVPLALLLGLRAAAAAVPPSCARQQRLAV